MEPGNALQYIRDVIQHNQLESDEVLRRMHFNREQGAVNYYQLKEGLIALDPSLSEPLAVTLAKTLLKNR